MTFKPYPKYKVSGVEWLGDVPEGWNVKRLKHISPEQVVGIVVNPSNFVVDEGLPFIYGGDIQEGKINLDTKRRIDDTGNSRNPKSILRSGDLVTVRVGAPGITAVVPPELDGGNCASVMLTRRSVRFDSGWLCYAMNSHSTRCQVQVVQYGAAQEQFNIGHAVNFIIATPSLRDQNSIANFLDVETAKIDTLIAKQEAMISLLQEKRQAVISHAVTKGLDPSVAMKHSGVEWLGDVPAHWATGALRRIARRVVVGIAEAATHAYCDEGIPILRATNIRSGKIIGNILQVTNEYSGGRDTKTMQTGDLVTVRTGNAGVTAVIPKEFDGAQCFTMLITSLEKHCDSQFYCYFMNSEGAKAYFSLEGWGTAQINISVPILQNLPISIPEHAEQLRIVTFLDSATAKIDALITKAQQAIALQKEHRTALISAAVTGKIDVRNELEDENCEELAA